MTYTTRTSANYGNSCQKVQMFRKKYGSACIGNMNTEQGYLSADHL